MLATLQRVLPGGRRVRVRGVEVAAEEPGFAAHAMVNSPVSVNVACEMSGIVWVLAVLKDELSTIR